MKNLLTIIALLISTFAYSQTVEFSYQTTDATPWLNNTGVPIYGASIPGSGLVANGHAQTTPKIYVNRVPFSGQNNTYFGALNVTHTDMTKTFAERQLLGWAEVNSNSDANNFGRDSRPYLPQSMNSNYFTVALLANYGDTTRINQIWVGDGNNFSYFTITQTGCGSKSLDYFTISGSDLISVNTATSLSVNTWTNTGYNYVWNKSFSGANYETSFQTKGNNIVTLDVYNACGDFLGTLSHNISVVGVATVTSGIVSQDDEIKVSVYPNPFTEYFVIHGLKHNETFALYDLNGNEVPFQSTSNDNNIEVRVATKGVIILKTLTTIKKLISE